VAEITETPRTISVEEAAGLLGIGRGLAYELAKRSQMSNNTVSARETLRSTGEHLGALRRLPDTYSDAEYLSALQRAREARDGEI
jgi:hypothetical protein